MEDSEIKWFAEEISKHEKRYLNMIISDLNEINKMPLFSIKSKLKKVIKKYLEMNNY